MRPVAPAIVSAIVAAVSCTAFAQPVFTTQRILADGRFNSEVDLALDSQGNAHIVFTKADMSAPSPTEHTRDIWYATDAGGAWAFTRITNNDVRDAHPVVAVDADDRVHIAFHTASSTQTGAANRIRYASNVSGAFPASDAAITIVANNNGFEGYDNPEMAVDLAGAAHLVFMSGNGLQYRSYRPAQNGQSAQFGTMQDVSPIIAYAESEHSVVAGPDGAIHLAFRTSNLFDPELEYYRKPAGAAGFTRVPTHITQDLNGQPGVLRSPIPVVTPDNRLCLVYWQAEMMRIVEANPDGSFPEFPVPVDLTPRERTLYPHRLAVAEDGRRYFAYAHIDAPGGVKVLPEPDGGFWTAPTPVDVKATAQPAIPLGKGGEYGAAIAARAGFLRVVWVHWDFRDGHAVADLYVSTAPLP